MRTREGKEHKKERENETQRSKEGKRKERNRASKLANRDNVVCRPEERQEDRARE